MGKSPIYRLIVGFLATSIFVCVESAPQEVEPNPISLGTVDGKTFFYDNTLRTWSASKTYCESFKMQLGKITTQGQQNLLKEKYEAGLFNGNYWTSARDARNREQFVWDTDQSSLLEIGPFGSRNKTYTCVYYLATSYSSTNGGWTSAACHNGNKVICETV